MTVCFLGPFVNGRYHTACRYSDPVVWNSASANFIKICYYGRQWDLIWCNVTLTQREREREREREMFYLTTHSTHFIYGYMASDIWLRTILIVRKETRCRHIGYSYRLTARVLLYAPSHRQDNTYHGLCYTSRGALAGTRNSSMGPPHEGSIRRPTAPWANALPLSYVPLLLFNVTRRCNINIFSLER